eukprot:superscaffoldBa00008541_g23426
MAPQKNHGFLKNAGAASTPPTPAASRLRRALVAVATDGRLLMQTKRRRRTERAFQFQVHQAEKCDLICLSERGGGGDDGDDVRASGDEDADGQAHQPPSG